MADRLCPPGQLLTELVAGDLTLRGSLMRRYGGCDVAQRRVFRLLGLLPSENGHIGDIAPWMLGALLGEPASGHSAASGLVAAGLLEPDPANGGAHRLSAPVSELARELLAGEQPAEVAGAQRRLRDRGRHEIHGKQSFSGPT